MGEQARQIHSRFRTSLDVIDHGIPSSYLVIPGFLGLDTAQALLTRAQQLLDEFNIEDHPLVC